MAVPYRAQYPAPSQSGGATWGGFLGGAVKHVVRGALIVGALFFAAVGVEVGYDWYTGEESHLLAQAGEKIANLLGMMEPHSEYTNELVFKDTDWGQYGSTIFSDYQGPGLSRYGSNAYYGDNWLGRIHDGVKEAYQIAGNYPYKTGGTLAAAAVGSAVVGAHTQRVAERRQMDAAMRAQLQGYRG